MVLPGQFLERPALIKEKNFYLDGLFQKGRLPKGDSVPYPPALIAPSRPPYGAGMVSPVVAEITYAFYKIGCPTLRFDFRGIGASRGKASDDPKAGEKDFICAAALLKETVGTEVYLAAGYSFGAYIAYRCASSEPFIKLVLLAPLLKELDFFSLPFPHCPVLIIVGEKDSLCPLEEARKLIEPLGERGKIKIVKEADHYFTAGLGEIVPSVKEFIEE